MHAVRQGFDATTTNARTTSATSTTSSTASPAMPIETLVPEGSSTFNGKSFAAGFIPGIAIGAALLFGIFFLLARRRRKREEVTEMTTPPASSDGFSSAKAAFARRKTRRQISDPIVQPEFSTRTAFYHYGSPSKTGSDITTSTAPSPPDTSTVEKALPIPHTRKRSSSAYETNTSGLPSTPFSHTTSNFAVPSLFHQTPSPAPPAIPTTTPLPFPPAPPTPKGSTTPPHPLRQKSSQRSLRRQLSRFRKTSAPSPSLAHLSRTSSKRRRVGSWSSGDDRSLSGDERGGNGRESRGTIRVVMSPPRQGPLPMGFGPVLRANMPPPSWAGGAGGGSGGAGAGGVMGPRSGEGDGGGMHPILPEGMAYAHTDLPYPERIVVANMGEKRQGLGVGQGQGSGAGQGQGYNLRTPPRVPGQVQGGLGSPYTPSKHRGGQGAGDRGTTFGEMMERAGVGRQDLERGRGV
ncbi:hypothetical protein KVT40_008075 [Elsinoe batatas]|uniref:Uncharacterized protein n=1 Tax=Elsinoe batatas TaxID=2601811 RepID=A0A8K0PF11_9PEZI|nr:hypothetical protein KVT40_008075 [Elsinoe batatas]